MEEWHKAEEELRNTLEDEWAEGQSKLPIKKEDTTTKTKKTSLKLTDIVQTIEDVENSKLPGPVKRQKVLGLLKNVYPSFDDDQLVGEIIDLLCG